MALNRRQFIQIGAAGFGAAAATSGLTSNLWGLTPDTVPDPQTDGDRVVPTFCEVCFWKCGVLAHVKDGRVTKITGNPAHPLSRGRLCPRGTAGAGLLYDPDRIRTPLIRTQKRGEQVFEAVDWDTALDHTAEKLLAVRDKYGPEAVAFFKHGYGASWFSTLFKGFGTSNITAPSYAQCRGSRETAFDLTFGAPVGSPEVLDLENSRVITLIGSHLGENMHNTQVQELARAMERGAELVVVDPRFSVAAGKAKYWLPIKPGTDIALLLAWMHVIIEEKRYDREFVADHTVGFEALAKHVADKTPAWAFVRTGIAVETIVQTARFIAGARPASLVHPGRRASWYGDDTQRGRALAILSALLGSWGRKGGFYIPDKLTVPAYAGIPKPGHHPAPPSDMPPGVVYPFAGKTLAHGIRDASIPGDRETAIKSWFVYGTNLFKSLPQRERTLEALRALDFVVTVDVLPVEMTGWSDVVLPEATYLERYDDLHGPAFKQGFLALRQPVVPPQHESRPGWWIARSLAERMGLDDYFPWSDPEEYLSERLEAGGFSLAQIKETGVILKEPGPITYEDGIEPSFATPSGKVELYSQQLADAGLDPLPNFTPQEEGEPGQFRLLFGRAPTHTFGRTTNNRILGQIADTNELWMNAETALEQGLEHGQLVTMVNQDGAQSLPIRLKATQRIRHDCVYMVHGFGHRAAKLTFAHERGASDADLVTRTKIDPVMGGTGLNVNFVRIEKVVA